LVEIEVGEQFTVTDEIVGVPEEVPPFPLPLPLPPQPETSSTMERAKIVGNADDVADRFFKTERELRKRRPRRGEMQDDG